MLNTPVRAPNSEMIQGWFIYSLAFGSGRLKCFTYSKLPIMNK